MGGDLEVLVARKERKPVIKGRSLVTSPTLELSSESSCFIKLISDWHEQWVVEGGEPLAGVEEFGVWP